MKEFLSSRRVARVLLGFAVLITASCRVASAQEVSPPAEGTIAGKILDASTGDPIIEAGVEVVGGGKKVRTDLDGKYTIKLPPGTYELRVFAPLYQGMRLQKVVVQAGQTARGDASLAPQGQAAVEVVEVVAQANKAAEATQLIARKKSAVVSDNISAETISKSTDSNAGEIVTRVPAVTVKDSKFIVVRGLNERYTSALLNGSRLPSTDPEKRIVPLDLFPSDFLESLSVYKTYTPDLPGDFSGGLADIKLRDFPERFSLNLGVNSGVNTEATFQKFNTYKGAGTADYFGFGSGYRSLPNDFPSNLRSAPGAQRQALGRELPNIWNVTRQTAPPNFGANFSVGNSWGPLGAAVSGVYSTEYKERSNQIEREFLNKANSNPDPSGNFPPPIIDKSTDFNFDIDRFETRLGGIFTSAYQPTENHKIAFRSLVNRNTSDEVTLGEGTVEAQGGRARTTTQLQYKEERLAFGQLSGEHRWPEAQLNWRTAYSQTTQDVPDTRIVTRQLPDTGGPGGFTNDGSGGIRYFTNLEERLTDSAVDLTVPFKTKLPFTDVWSDLPAKLKVGPSYAYRNRDFTLRRFRYRGPQNIDDTLPTEVLLAPENIGPFNAFDFKEEGLPGDSFKGTHEILGGYGMIDAPLFAGWRSEDGTMQHQIRLVAGVRTEYSYISLKTFDTSGQAADPKKNNLDPLPGVNLIYSPRDDMNLRFGYSKSVSRPEFRELSPVQYPSPRGLRPTIGNPELVESQIESYDARWEWFLSSVEIVSFSFFYKQLDKPIEEVVIAQSSNLADSFANADTATLTGFEFEGRKNFGWITPRLADLSLLTNVAYVDSSVSVPRVTLKSQIQTSTNRALQGQSPYVVNAALDYTNAEIGTVRVQYNTVGSRIAAAGDHGLPDINEEPRNELDLVLLRKINPFGTPLHAKVGIENILDDNYLFTEGDFVQRRYRSGVKFSFGLSYSY